MTDRYIDLIGQNREQFSDEFVEWFPKNEHIWKLFVRETFAVIGVGFKHYSARTIIHFLRHHTAVMERTLSGFKISNNTSPYLARLFALAYPDRAYIFRYKHTPKAHKDNRGRRENHDFFEDAE